MSVKLHHAEPGPSHLERARNILRQNFIEAMCEDPKRIIDTPGWKTKRWSAAKEFEELLGDVGMDECWLQLANVLGRVADAKVHQLTHLMAQALLAELAEKHARWHGDDLAEQLKEEDEK